MATNKRNRFFSDSDDTSNGGSFGQRNTGFNKYPGQKNQLRSSKSLTRARIKRKKLRVNRRRGPGKTTRSINRAKGSLKNFRQASVLAIAMTSMLLLFLNLGEETSAQTINGDTADALVIFTDSAGTSPATTAATDTTSLEEEEPSAKEATDEALQTLRGMWNGVYRNLPKMGVALAALLVAWLLVRGVRKLLRKILGRWERSEAFATVAGIIIWLLAIGIAVSVVAGDIMALVGSLGLVGLALSWSLQTPIESFTGWLLNSFQGYYRVGDRISVGDVFGDVYQIDFLTTTVWEIGAPYKPGFVQAEQPTGRLVTFPNSEVLAGTIVNLTRDFEFVWDEMDVAVANESDIRLAMKVLESVSCNLLGDYMVAPAQLYENLLQKAGLEISISSKPQVFLSATDSWTNITVRYLVGARERRKWKSELLLLVTEEFNKPEYIGKLIPAYTRQQVQFIRPDGIPADLDELGDDNNEEDRN